jgi:two-component system, NtrC family, response regulator
MRPKRWSMILRFLHGLLAQNNRASGRPSLNPGRTPTNPATSGAMQETLITDRRDYLFAFVDFKDPFADSEIHGEERTGPVLSIMSYKTFYSVFLFHTPHTRNNALATRDEAARRHPNCRVSLIELEANDPNDYSVVLYLLARKVRDLDKEIRARELFCHFYVCVSSGTTEMRGAWFLLTGLRALTATLLQVGSPLQPLFGAANVKEVVVGSDYWVTLRQLVMPVQYLLAQRRASAAETTQWESVDRDLAQRSLEAARVESTNDVIPGLDDALKELDIYVGSAVLRHAAERAGIAARSDLPTLLVGETGTGKERFAHLMHRMSSRASRELVAVNCAAIPESLAEDHLFGHVKGAFTGASADRKGLFESADGSTLFLDEVAELSLEVQAKLLRVIQDGVVQRTGSTTPRKVDVRIIAATNRNLKNEVSAGRFREDLYFRLEVVQIELPSLRHRRGDIPELAIVLLRKINQRRHKPRQLSPGALLRLERYDWPGNVRQLRNVLERSVLYARGESIEAEDLIITQDQGSKVNGLALPELRRGFKIDEYLSGIREQLFDQALLACNGNQSCAADLLGVTKQAVSKFVASRTTTKVDP